MTPEIRAEVEAAHLLLLNTKPAFNSREWEAMRRLEHAIELDDTKSMVCASCGDPNRRAL